ncbi:hypothetical protein D8M35_16310 [Curtobacterium sp. HSID17257]|nr:hypothetical protein D8M35_16310 [Curtobacterium sp. HSID17257]
MIADRSSSLTLVDGSDISLKDATSCWLGNVRVSTSSRRAVTCAVTTTDQADRRARWTCSTTCGQASRSCWKPTAATGRTTGSSPTAVP